jgi:hypothetical protein
LKPKLIEIIFQDSVYTAKKLTCPELHNLYSSPDIIRQVKSNGIWWAGHVVSMGEERKYYNVWVGIPKETVHLEDQGVGGNMRSEWICG